MFSSILGWLIRALNGSANRVVRGLGVEPQEELASARSPEELGLLAAISARAGELPEDTARMLQRTIRFGDKRAAEAMTPRVDMVALPVTATLDELVAAALDSGHSRFPVYESTVDIVTGVVSVIDALAVPAPRRPAETVAGIAREPVYVPESLDLDGVLEALQAAGAVTVEDLAEELVGEIADEYDVEPAAYEVTVPLSAMPSTLLVDGVVREDELAESTGFRLTEGPYETLAGFIMARLGHIPVEGETVEEHGWKFTVVEVQRRRIEKVRVTRPEEPDG